MEKTNNGFTFGILGIIAIVAIVGMFTMFSGGSNSADTVPVIVSGDYDGQATRISSSSPLSVSNGYDSFEQSCRDIHAQSIAQEQICRFTHPEDNVAMLECAQEAECHFAPLLQACGYPVPDCIQSN